MPESALASQAVDPQTSASQALEREFIIEVAPVYLAKARPPKPERVASWRSRSLLPLLNRLHSPVTGLVQQHMRVDGHRMVWLEGGNRLGEPVVLLHGFGASKENWLPLLPFLAKRYHLFIPDLPAWGESQFNPEARYGMDEQVARVATWLPAAVRGPAHVVGNSMGGGVAGLLAGRHPQLVRSLVLMNAAGVAGKQHTPFELGLMQGRNGLIAHNLKGVFDLLAMTMSSRILAALMAPAMSSDLISRRHVNEHLFRQLLALDPDPALPAFSSVQVPTLVLWGRDDHVLHVSCTEVFQKLIPQAQVKILDRVGHLPMVEVPRVTARLLRHHWRQTGSH